MKGEGQRLQEAREEVGKLRAAVSRRGASEQPVAGASAAQPRDATGEHSATPRHATS